VGPPLRLGGMQALRSPDSHADGRLRLTESSEANWSASVSPTLEQIYAEHRDGLFGLALSILRRVDKAEDAVHDAFERMWRRGTVVDGDPVAYAYKAVRNASIDQMRKKQPGEAPPLSIFEADEVGPVGQLMNEESAMLLRQAVDALPDEQREAVVMRVWGGLSFEQMAEATGLPMGTVASRYRRALAKLKEEVEALQ